MRRIFRVCVIVFRSVFVLVFLLGVVCTYELGLIRVKEYRAWQNIAAASWAYDTAITEHRLNYADVDPHSLLDNKAFVTIDGTVCLAWTPEDYNQVEQYLKGMESIEHASSVAYKAHLALPDSSVAAVLGFIEVAWAMHVEIKRIEARIATHQDLVRNGHCPDIAPGVPL